MPADSETARQRAPAIVGLKRLAKSEAKNRGLAAELKTTQKPTEQPFPWSYKHTAERLHISTRKLYDHLKDIEAAGSGRPYTLSAARGKTCAGHERVTISAAMLQPRRSRQLFEQ